METIYRILKILIAVLLVAVLFTAILVFSRKDAEEPVIPTAATASAETSADTATEPATIPADPTSADNANLAPDFTVYDADGNAHTLSDFRGKPVILNFWASWCGPCKAEMPDLEAAYQAYGDSVEFLIVNLTDGSTETVETASGYVSSQGYTFPVYYDTAMEGAIAYRVYAIPTTYFIDANGEIRALQEGMISAEVLESNIQALLAQ